MPDVVSGGEERAPHLVRVVVRRAVGLVVQVVELAHSADPAGQHLGVRGARELEVEVRGQPRGEVVHLLAPGPEAARALLRAAAQRPVEGVRVRVRHGRDADSGGHATSPAEHVGQRLHPGDAVGGLGELLRRVRDAGRVADEEHRGRDPGGLQDAGVVAGLGRQHRQAGTDRRARGRRRTRTAPVTDSAVTMSEVPSRSARSAACFSTAATRSASAASESARASSQAVTRDGTAFVPFGCASTRPKVARWPASRACLLAASAVIAKVSIGSARSSIRVVPHGRRGR